MLYTKDVKKRLDRIRESTFDGTFFKKDLEQQQSDIGYLFLFVNQYLMENKMPDISKCDNKDCPLKDSCYRFTCVPSDLQSYDFFEFKDEFNIDHRRHEVSCEFFMKQREV